MKLNKLNAMVVALGLVGATSAMGVSYTEVTTHDYNPGLVPGGIPWGFANPGVSDGLGIASEDNETEATSAIHTTQAQAWDFEAFAWGDNATLDLISGYDLINGKDGLMPGDLFIQVGSFAQLPYLPVANSGVVPNNYVYDLAIRWAKVGNAYQAKVEALGATTPLQTIIYDSLGSNPLRVNGAVDDFAIGASYKTVTSATTGTTIDGISLQGFNGNKTHYVLTLSMGWLNGYVKNTLGLNPDQTDVFLSWTMDCGNDMGKAKIPGGGYRTPDGGATLALLGFGLTAMGFVGRRVRKD